MRFASLLLQATLSCAAAPAVACVDLISGTPPFARESFRNLEEFKPRPTLPQGVTKIQDLAEHGQGELNIDQYSIKIDSAGQSAQEFMAELRMSLNEVVYDGSYYGGLHPADTISADKWASENPLGAVMLFDLAKLSGWETTLPGLGRMRLPDLSLERAGVMVTCWSDTSFIFTPVTMGSKLAPNVPGLHPVAGHRGFGIKDNEDGSLTIFVQAADRVTNEGIFSTMRLGTQEIIFHFGAQVWEGMLASLEKKFSHRRPREKVIFSDRLPGKVRIDDRRKYLYGDSFLSDEFLFSRNLRYVEEESHNFGVGFDNGFLELFFKEKPSGYGVLAYPFGADMRIKEIQNEQGTRGESSIIDAVIEVAIKLDTPEIGEQYDPNELAALMDGPAVYIESYQSGYLMQAIENRIWQEFMPSLIDASLIEERAIRRHQLMEVEIKKFSEFAESSRRWAQAERQGMRQAISAQQFGAVSDQPTIQLEGIGKECGINCIRQRIK
ncbi:hypothetical protein [Paracoccus marcusii]|uniref:hypothetical protein n=1 Tax=Paracoccus marcusii TaxID=59779 RepID=UPI0011128DD8|nr:hypothetical protein [Paracoccus marcusii]TNB89695.1 hypothetical protein FHD68_17045 [Paracoccus marcusii]